MVNTRMRLLVLLVLLVGVGCSSNNDAKQAPPTADTKPKAKKDPAAAKELLAKGAVALDVRKPDEFSSGHLDRATNIPVQDLSARLADVEKLVGGDKSKPVVVYCAAGGRAAKAKEQLEAAGYTQVVNGGGYDDLR
jgi:phage shock protein E